MTKHFSVRAFTTIIFACLLMASLASAQFTLTTTFASGNGQSGNIFDIEAINPVLINSFDVHMQTAGTVNTYEVYYKTSRASYVGSEGNAADWTLLASTTATGAGPGVPTPLNLSLGFAMAPGEKIGFYVTSTGTTVGYTNGTAVGALYASDANINFFEGVGIAYPWAGTFSPRIFNGNIHYNLSGGGFADDLACFTVDSPSDAGACSSLGSTEAVSFTVFNFGSNAIGVGGSFTADLVLDGTLVTTEPFTTIAGMPSFASEQFTFTTTLDLSAGGPRTIDVIINYSVDQDLSNNTGSIAIDAGAPNDIACVSVDSPFSVGTCTASSTIETVAFTINNLGANSLTIGSAFTGDLILDGSLVTTEAFTILGSDILCGGTASFTFATTLDLSTGGARTIDVSLTYGGDANPLNDSASRSVNAGAAFDLACSSVDGPADASGCNVLSNAETVPFTVTHLGANTLFIGSVFAATLNHNGFPVATENFTVVAGDITCGGSASFAFGTTVDLSAGGPQNLSITVNLGGDGLNGNDSASRVVNATGPGGAVINTFPFSEDFETFGTGTGNSSSTPIQNGWQQDPADGTGINGDWWFGLATSSGLAGPETNGLGDHTSGTGRFAHIEDSGTTNPVINLWSPCFDLTGLTNPAMRLWVNSHYYGPSTAYFNPVHVDLLTAGGTVSSIASVLTDTGDAWVPISVSLVPYIGQIVQFQIRGSNAAGLQFCDSAIDDFTVFEQTLLSGQMPQAGIATLDINGATNANTNTVASGDNGPYAFSVPQNGRLLYTITGEPFAGVLLLGGPLNVQVATYPGYGQFDIGNLPLNAMGIPGGLYVWADGITQPLRGLNQFFVIDPNGSTTVDIGIPVLPLGTLTSFQCINTHSVQLVGFSNTVQMSIVP